MKKTKKKLFDKNKMVKELARERVGVVPGSKIFKEKTRKKRNDVDFARSMSDYTSESDCD